MAPPLGGVTAPFTNFPQLDGDVPPIIGLTPEQKQQIQQIAAIIIGQFLQSMIEQPSAWQQFLGGQGDTPTAPTLPQRNTKRGIAPRDITPNTDLRNEVLSRKNVVPAKNGIPGGLKPNAARGAALVREKFGFKGDIGGMRPKGVGKPSDHHHGNAIDVMTRGNRAQGLQIRDYFIQNAKDLGVKYVICEQTIYSADNGWKGRKMEDRGSPTANHMDHPHISFY